MIYVLSYPYFLWVFQLIDLKQVNAIEEALKTRHFPVSTSEIEETLKKRNANVSIVSMFVIQVSYLIPCT